MNVEVFLDCCKNPKACNNRAADGYSYALKLIPDCYKTEMFDKAVDACPPALKIVFDGFVMDKMLDKYDDVVFSNV